LMAAKAVAAVAGQRIFRSMVAPHVIWLRPGSPADDWVTVPLPAHLNRPRHGRSGRGGSRGRGGGGNGNRVRGATEGS